MGGMAAEWVLGCQRKLPLFLQRISGYLFPSCPQWSLRAGNCKMLALLGDEQALLFVSSIVEEERSPSVPMPPLLFLSGSVVSLPPFLIFSLFLPPAQSSGRTEQVCPEALPVYAPCFCPSLLAVCAVGGGWWREVAWCQPTQNHLWCLLH